VRESLIPALIADATENDAWIKRQRRARKP
jgi:hypothetical protein